MSPELSGINLEGWSLLKITGSDSTRFLNGQLTCNVEDQVDDTFQEFARTDRTGRLLFWGYLLKKSNSEYFIFIEESESGSLKDDLNKFIIMDDVELEILNERLIIDSSFKSDEGFAGSFMGIPALVKFGNVDKFLKSDEKKRLEFFFGKNSFKKGSLLSDTPLVDIAVSKAKGCYVGQETINKIENNRGAAKKDILIFIENELKEIPAEVLIDDECFSIENNLIENTKTYLKINAPRRLRVDGKSIQLEMDGNTYSGKVTLLPMLLGSLECKSREMFEKGSEYFAEDKEKEALSLFRFAYRLNPEDPEVLESLGVLEGRLGNYNNGISLMDKLEQVSPDSVMPYTNRSLFYMKMGEIEKAEDEKAKATLKSMGGVKVDEEQARQEKIKRLGMYKEILEIDPDDEMANQGAAQIYFDLGEVENSEKCVDKLIEQNNQNYKALALKAKILLLAGENAESFLNNVIKMASEKGDFVLANEFQNLLTSVTETS